MHCQSIQVKPLLCVSGQLKSENTCDLKINVFLKTGNIVVLFFFNSKLLQRNYLVCTFTAVIARIIVKQVFIYIVIYISFFNQSQISQGNASPCPSAFFGAADIFHILPIAHQNKKCGQTTLHPRQHRSLP